MLSVFLNCLRPVSCVPNVASVSELPSSCVLCTKCYQSSCVLCTKCCQCLWIVHSWLPLRFSLTFMEYYITMRSGLDSILYPTLYVTIQSFTRSHCNRICQGVIDFRNIERPHSALLIIQTCFVHMFACLIVVTSKFICLLVLLLLHQSSYVCLSYCCYIKVHIFHGIVKNIISL